MSKRVVLTGGGTAGHVMPNLALVPFLKDFELHYVGCANSVEERLVKEKAPHIVFHAIPAVKLERGKLLKNLAIPFKLCKSVSVAKKLLKALKPDLIFSKGGFVALPVSLASKNIPLILHESDFSFGLANKLALKKCSTICTSFSDLAYNTNKAIHTGSPLRQEIYNGNKNIVLATIGRASTPNFTNKKNLLIFGGSLGAVAINNAVFSNIDYLTQRYNVVHITGKNCDRIIEKRNYYSAQFVQNIPDFFAWADFCITRGGANALFELIALNVPSLVIPLPKGASRGDQILNANYFKNLGCVEVLEQDKLEHEQNALITSLEQLEKNAPTLKAKTAKQTNIDGTKKIVSIIKDNLL